ncbi:MAG: hypothetical protein OEZ59_01515 [Deltaproteobacteria bacterium]|nr:hypothetical protein [Deltaproteobacteria bacterium]
MRIFISAIFLIMLAGLSWTQDARAAMKNLDVVRIILAEKIIRPGRVQLVQVEMRNNGSAKESVGLKMEVRDDGDQRRGKPLSRVVTIPGGEKKLFYFKLPSPEFAGDYSVRMEVYDPGFKKNALVGKPVYYTAFQVGVPASPYMAGLSTGDKGQSRQIPVFRPPQKLTFEKADLLWENVQLASTGLMVGEPLRIKADIRNMGGDIARAVEVRLDYFNVALPSRLHNISRHTLPVLAPGEKVEMEFEHVFADNIILGNYKMVLIADAADVVVESSEKNNRYEFRQPIRLSHIKQMFPPPDYVFEETGLFLFRWDSLRYNEFKVQVSAQPGFDDPEVQFDIPQGEKWLRDKEVVPLAGELPGMALGLMERSGGNKLYWRVLGRNSETDQNWYSMSLPFTIRPEPGARKSYTDAPEERPGEQEQQPPPEEVPGSEPQAEEPVPDQTQAAPEPPADSPPEPAAEAPLQEDSPAGGDEKQDVPVNGSTDAAAEPPAENVPQEEKAPDSEQPAPDAQ